MAGATLLALVMVAELGLTWAAGKSGHIGVSYSGQIAGPTRDHSVQANWRWAF